MFIEKPWHAMPNAQLTGKQAQQLRVIAGQLKWTSSQTRPHISYQAGEISTSVKDATIYDLKTADKYMRKLESSEVILRFLNLSTIEKWKLLCFTNASFSDLKSGSSQGGLIIFLCGKNKSLPLHEVKKIKASS